MRIHNSRFLFPLLEGRYFDKRFLVEEVNRLIGWSCYPLRKPQSQDMGEDQQNGDLQPTITEEMKALNCKDEEKGKKSYMLEESSQLLKRANGEKVDTCEESIVATSYQRDGSSCFVAVTSAIALPLTSSRPEEELPFKKRKLYYQWDTEIARDDGEYEMMKEKMDTTNMHEQEHAQDESSTNTTGFGCAFNCECATPPDNDSPKTLENPEEMVLEKTVDEAKEKRRSGRKRTGPDQLAEGNKLIESKGKRARKRGRPRRQITNRNNWVTFNNKKNLTRRCDEMQKPIWGRPKRASDEKQKQKRGRPKRVNNQSNIGSEAKQKRKIGRPRRS